MNQQLLDAREQLGRVLRAAEQWEDIYKDDPEGFERLIRLERRLERHSLTYFRGLAERSPALVKWHLMPIRAADYPAYVDESVQVRDLESRLFYGLIFDDLAAVMAVGFGAGEAAYGMAVGFGRVQSLVMDAARTHVGTLVTSVTETNLDLIRESVRTSIALAEPATDAITRMQSVIKNPVRAEMIARTESVNAYQIGLRLFAHETGAISKTWQSLRSGACKVCAPLNDVTVAIDDAFAGLRGPLLRPTAHPRCRCGLRYNYPND